MDKRTANEFEGMLNDFEAVSEIEAKSEVNGSIVPIAAAYAAVAGPIYIISKLFG